MKNRTRDNTANCAAQKGAALVVGLLMTTVLAIVGVNAAKSSVAQQRMANNYRFSIEAMNNAEVGIAIAINQMNLDRVGENGFDDELDANGDGVTNDRLSFVRADRDSNTFFITVIVDDDDGDGNPSVDSNGIVRLMSQGSSDVGSTRTIDVRISTVVTVTPPIMLNAAIMVEGDLEISGNPTLGGANQNIHSNSDILISGDPSTSGNISAVGTVSGSPDGGGTTESGAAYVELPHIDPADYAEYADYVFHSDGDIYDGAGNFVADADGVEWQGWKFVGDKWNTEGSDVQGGMLYFKGEYGNVQVGSNPGSVDNPWEISILADGYIEISGNPTIGNYADPDDPPAVQALLLMSGSDIKINGNPSQTYDGIIAAAEQISVSGNPTIEGALIAADQSNDTDFVVENSISGDITLSYGGGFGYPGAEGEDHGKVFALSWRDLEIARGTDVFAPVIEVTGQTTGY